MSQETSRWLNTNTLIGFTDKRGHAWHYRAEHQGAETNHYAGAIPVEDVRRRLFNWQAVEGMVSACAITSEGVLETVDPDRKAIMRSDTGAILGVFKSGYEIHQFDEWLLETVATLLDGDLSIGSAGLLKGGAVAWVQVEVPDSIVTPEGVRFRPHLLAATSHDGSMATTYKRAITNVVCDNTMSAALGENGQAFKIKHSRYSRLLLADARDALSIIHTTADQFTRQVAELTAVKVSERDFGRFLDRLVPLPKLESSNGGSRRSLTMAENKREILTRLWQHDERVAPWRGTAWGVLQAVNTAAHHEFIVRGADRAERNMARAVDGTIDKLDAETLDMLTATLA